MIKKEYASPYVESIKLEAVGCIMASAGGNLGNLDENPIIDNAPMYPFEGGFPDFIF